LKNRIQLGLGPGTTLSSTIIFDYPKLSALLNELLMLLGVKEKDRLVRKPDMKVSEKFKKDQEDKIEKLVDAISLEEIDKIIKGGDTGE